MEMESTFYHDGDPTPHRRRTADGDHAGQDLLSALPDDLLIAILERVDSRTAVSTSALSRRWRRLDPAGSLSAFELSVATHLPPEYPRAVDLYLDARARSADLAALADRVSGLEDRAMEAYARGLAGFLRAPGRCRRARSLRFELFVTPIEAAAGVETAACLDAALRWPGGLQLLAVDAVPRAAAGREQPPHLLPAAAAAAPDLAALHVTNCLLSPDNGRSSCGGAFPALTSLTAKFSPRVAVRCQGAHFNSLMRECHRLESLRLVSCGLSASDQDDGFTVDLPPASRLRELVVETCSCGKVNLENAPSLERLVLERCDPLDVLRIKNAPRLQTLVCRGGVPRLRGAGTASLRFVELSVLHTLHGEHRLESFFRGIPNVEELSLCFRGRMIWVEPEHPWYRFENLNKLSINIPRLWPLDWMKRILRIAPCLEKLHIYIFKPSSETLELVDRYPCKKTIVNFRHTSLKEIQMVGFEGAEQQMALIRFFMTSCRTLKTVILIGHHALLEKKLDRQGGIACPSWLMEDEQAEIVSELSYGIHSDAEIVLG